MWGQTGWVEWSALLGAGLIWHLSVRAARAGHTGREVWLAGLAAVLIFVGLFRMWVVEPFDGYGPSMRPTLPHQSTLLVDKSAFGLRVPGVEWWIWRRADPLPGDVVVARSPLPSARGLWLVKRIVAVEGDKVRVEGERLFVNDHAVEQAPPPGQPLPASFLTNVWVAETMGHRHRVWLQESLLASSPQIVTWTVPRGHVFLAGDNRKDSLDSRSFGPVPVEGIIGRVFAVWDKGGLRDLDESRE